MSDIELEAGTRVRCIEVCITKRIIWKSWRNGTYIEPPDRSPPCWRVCPPSNKQGRAPWDRQLRSCRTRAILRACRTKSSSCGCWPRLAMESPACDVVAGSMCKHGIIFRDNSMVELSEKYRLHDHHNVKQNCGKKSFLLISIAHTVSIRFL